MPKSEITINPKAVFKIYLQHTFKYPWLLGAIIFFGVLQQASNVVSPIFLKDFFNILTKTTPAADTATTAVVALGIYGAVSLLGWAGGRGEMWLGCRAIARITADLTEYALQGLLRHSYSFFASSFAGALTRRVGRFRDGYETLHYAIITSVLQAAIYIIGITGVLMYQNKVLGSVVLVWIVLFVSLQVWLTRFQRTRRLERAKQDSNLTAAVADTISNQNTVALFAGNKHEQGLLGKAVEVLRLATEAHWRLSTIVYGLQEFLSVLLSVGMLWLCLHYWQQNMLTVGDIVLVQMYMFGIFHHIWGLGRQFYNISNTLSDSSEMAQILETEPGVKDKKGAKKLKVSAGEVWFDDVTFRFHKEIAVLEQFNLKIAGGERVALVGPSGAGKSTVTRLLLRLYDVEQGEIKVDGQKITDVTQDSLREQISFVPQEPILFHRTLMENIRYGKRDASEEEVMEAAKAAHCHEFISQLPQGYETYVGERGIKLSGGERQRVAIARAILKNAPVLVLDEATSSLDSESEALIQDALETLMRGKTVVVIAHRLSTIMKMDRIVVMEQGKIVAQGTHLELIKEQGLYAKLWSIQAGGFLGDTVPVAERKKKSRIK